MEAMRALAVHSPSFGRTPALSCMHLQVWAALALWLEEVQAVLDNLCSMSGVYGRAQQMALHCLNCIIGQQSPCPSQRCSAVDLGLAVCTSWSAKHACW